jgi:hypothetical protein
MDVRVINIDPEILGGTPVFNGTRGNTVLPDRGATSISIGKFRTESGQSGTNQIKLITNFRGKG